MKIVEFKRNSSQDPNCTLLESVCVRVLWGRYLRLEAKVVYESKVGIFFLAYMQIRETLSQLYSSSI